MKYHWLYNCLDWLCILAALALPVLAAGLLTGCTVTRWSNGQESFSRTSFGTTSTAQKIAVTVNPDGSRSMTITGYQSDGVQAVGVAVDAAVSAAVKAMKP